MTEECKKKAEKIGLKCCLQDGTNHKNCENAALEMAEWKDKQFIGLLDTLNHNAFPSHKDYVKYIKAFIGV